MKTVDLDALKQQLEVARDGDREQQKAFLASINSHSTNCVVINEMTDMDLRWIAPLALELFMPAIDVLTGGMRQKCRHWEEDYLDKDRGETVTVLRSEAIDGETVFTPDDKLLDQIGKNAIASLNQLNNDELKDLAYWGISPEARFAIDEELYRRGDPETIRGRGDLYQFGDEEHGIFIHHKEARFCYDLALKLGYELDEDGNDAWDDTEDPGEEYPSTYQYELTGNAETLNGVETLINDLCQRFGTPDNELGLYAPQRQLMKVLVGSDTEYYRGNVITMERESPDRLIITTEADNGDPLLYALRYTFENLNVEMK